MAQARSSSASGRQGGWGIAWVFPLVAVVAGLSGGYALGRGLRGPGSPPVAGSVPPSPSPAPAPAPAPAAPAVSVAPAPTAPAPPPEAPAAPPAPAEAAEAPANPAPAPSPGAVARVHIRSTPAGAQVARADDGEPLGTTPVDVELPESGEPVTLLFWKKGYAPTEKEITPRGEVTVTVQLPARKRRGGDSGISSTTTIDPFN